MSIRYGQFCPVAKAAEVLGERWTILIIRELLLGTSRYGDFQRTLARISPTLLTKRLGQLVDCGLVVRRTRPGKAHAEYHLTAAGRELQPIVTQLGEWGMKWARGQMGDDELDVELLMSEFCRRLDATRLPAGGAVIEFNYPGLPRFGRWWLVIEADSERELCVAHPGKPSDIQIRSDLRTMTEIWAGDTDIRTARREGRLQLTGDPTLIRTLASWLRPGGTAHIRPGADQLRV